MVGIRYRKKGHMKMRHKVKPGLIIFPNHGNHEVGIGLEKNSLSKQD